MLNKPHQNQRGAKLAPPGGTNPKPSPEAFGDAADEPGGAAGASQKAGGGADADGRV